MAPLSHAVRVPASEPNRYQPAEETTAASGGRYLRSPLHTAYKTPGAMAFWSGTDVRTRARRRRMRRCWSSRISGSSFAQDCHGIDFGPQLERRPQKPWVSIGGPSTLILQMELSKWLFQHRDHKQAGHFRPD